MRGVALTLAVLVMMSYLALVYESRIETLCCARKVHLLELRLARAYRVLENLEGVIYYNALRLLYSDDSCLFSSRRYAENLGSIIDALCGVFARTYNVSVSCKVLCLRGPFELNVVPPTYARAPGYVEGATCYRLCINLTMSDEYVQATRPRCFLLCHPVRYFAIKRAFNSAAEECIETGYCSKEYIRSYVEGILGDIEILTMNVSIANNCLVITAAVRDCKAEKCGVWGSPGYIVEVSVVKCRLKE